MMTQKETTYRAESNRSSSMKGSNTTHNQGIAFPLGSVGTSLGEKSIMGLSSSPINQRAALGTAWEESSGKTASNCSTGLKGSLKSNEAQSL